MDTSEHRSFWACDECHVIHAMQNTPPETCSVCSSKTFSLVVNVPGAEYTIEVIQEHENQDQWFTSD
jgi:hypothetical protein